MSTAHEDAKKYAASQERFRAQAALDLGRADEAEQHARRALADEPNSAQGHGLLARALIAKLSHEEAIAEVKAGLALAPQDEWLHRLYALALRKNDKPLALKQAEEAVRLAPESAPAHYLVSVISNDLGNKTGAYDAILRALALAPEDITYKRTLADHFLEQSPQKAEVLYRECLAIDARNALVLNNLGVALERQKKPLEAAVAYKSALLADPTLEIAKQNTHEVVGRYLKGTFSIMILVLVAVRVLMIGEGAIFLLLGLIVLVGAVYFFWRKNREADLERADPQLRAIFEQLDRDKKAGKL